MFVKNMFSVFLVLLFGDLALGAKPTEVSVVLDKAVTSASDDIYQGQSEMIVMTVKLPAGLTTGVTIELLPSTTDTIFALGELINHTVGADLTVGNPTWFNDVTFSTGPEYTDTELGVYYNTRAAFDLGDIDNNGPAATEEASTITIYFEVVYVTIGSHIVGYEFWVSCGMAYNNDNNIWISQFSYNLQGTDSGFTANNDFTVSSLTEIEDGGVIAYVDLTMKIANPRSKVIVEGLVLNETQDITPVKIEMVSAQKAYGYSLRPTKVLAKGYDDCYVRSTNQQTLQLDLGYIVNKESQKDSPSSDDYAIVMRISYLVTNPGVVGNTYTLGVGVDLNGQEISVATFDVNVIARSSGVGASSHTVTTVDTATVERGGVGFAMVTLTTPASSFESYTMKLSTNVKLGATSKLSILSYSSVSRGDNILCDIEDTVSLVKSSTDSTNAAVVNEAEMTFSLLNTGLMTSNTYEMKIGVMAMVDAVESTVYELNVEINGVNAVFEFTVGGLTAYDENVPYVFSSTIPNGTQVYAGSIFDMELQVVTSRNSLPGNMTIEVPIPDATPYVTLVKATTLSKGANVLCPPSGELDSAMSSWNDTLSDNARGVVSIPMVCNVESVNDTAEDIWSITLTLAVIDHADILVESLTNVSFGVGARFSGNQIFVGGDTVTTMKTFDLTDVKLATGIQIVDSPGPSEWSDDYHLQWSMDNQNFYSPKFEWQAQTSSTQTDFKLKRPVLTRYARLSTPTVTGLPAYDYTVTSTTIGDYIKFLGDATQAATLLPKVMDALDGDNDTCLSLPVKSDTLTPPYLITQIKTQLLVENGIHNNIDVNPNFKVQILGEGISCNASSGPQRTMVWNPKTAITTAFHGKFAKCANTQDVANYHGSMTMCEYECTCDTTDKCAYFVLAMIHDEATPSGNYSLCEIKLIDST